MKLSAIFTVLAVSLLMFGAAQALAAEPAHGVDHLAMVRQCERDFQRMDPANRGYITFNDFRHEYQGTSRKGLATTGNAYTAYASIRRMDPQRVTEQEFCQWRGR